MNGSFGVSRRQDGLNRDLDDSSALDVDAGYASALTIADLDD